MSRFIDSIDQSFNDYHEFIYNIVIYWGNIY